MPHNNNDDDLNPNPNRSISTRKKPSHRASLLDVFRRHKSKSRDSEAATDNDDDHHGPNLHQQHQHTHTSNPQPQVPPTAHSLPDSSKTSIPHSNPLASNPVYHHPNAPFFTTTTDSSTGVPNPVYINPLTANTLSNTKNNEPPHDDDASRSTVNTEPDQITTTAEDQQATTSLDWERHSQTAISAIEGVAHDNTRNHPGYQSGEESETVEVGGYVVRTMPVGPALPFWEPPRRRKGKARLGRRLGFGVGRGDGGDDMGGAVLLRGGGDEGSGSALEGGEAGVG